MLVGSCFGVGQVVSASALPAPTASLSSGSTEGQQSEKNGRYDMFRKRQKSSSCFSPYLLLSNSSPGLAIVTSVSYCAIQYCASLADGRERG